MECALENLTNMICLKQPPASQYTFPYANVYIVNQSFKQNFRSTLCFFLSFFQHVAFHFDWRQKARWECFLWTLYRVLTWIWYLYCSTVIGNGGGIIVTYILYIHIIYSQQLETVKKQPKIHKSCQKCWMYAIWIFHEANPELCLNSSEEVRIMDIGQPEQRK